jgi:hypothetical protein
MKSNGTPDHVTLIGVKEIHFMKHNHRSAEIQVVFNHSFRDDHPYQSVAATTKEETSLGQSGGFDCSYL